MKHNSPPISHRLIVSGWNSKDLITLSLFAIFSLFLVVQHSMVFLSHDDWGLAVLDYVGTQKGFNGQDFKFSHVFAFLTGMYENWTGRIFPVFLEIYLIKFGIWYLRLFQVLIIVSALLLSAKMAARADEKNQLTAPLLVLAILLYLSLPPKVLIGGVYWFSAAAGYLWGIPLFLLAAYCILIQRKITIGTSLLLGVSATFHEQMSFAVIGFFACHIIYDHFSRFEGQKTLEKIYLSWPVVLLSATTVFAPGNFNRIAVSAYGEKSFLDIVLTNLATISGRFFIEGTIFVSILILSFAALCFDLNRMSLKSLRDWLVAAAPAFICVSYLLLPHLFFAFLFAGLYSFAFFKACSSREAGIVMFSVFIASLASLAPLLLAPAIAPRSLTTFYFLLFVPVLFSVAVVSAASIKHLVVPAFGAVAIFSIINTSGVFNGYLKNYKANIFNHYQLMIAKNKNQNNIEIGKDIILFKLPARRYSVMMPYERPLIERWIKKYYELPQDVMFDWR